MHPILEIALDRLDHRLLALEDDVHDVGAALRIEAHMGADRKPAAVDQQRGEPRFDLAGSEIDLRARTPQGAVQPAELRWGQGLDPFEQGAGMAVGGGHLLLFGIGHRQNAQGQDLVDLGAVEQIAWAFGGDLRVVVKNDRRGQHRVAVPLAADQHRPGPLIDAGRRGLA